MFKTLDRYILRAFFTNYVIALGVMIGLYVILDLFVNLDEFMEARSRNTQIIARIMSFYGYNLFLYFAQLSGIIILVAACFTMGRFHRTNELTAVLASGTSLYRVAAPVILAALGLNALWFIDQELLIPKFADKLSRKHSDIEGRTSFPIWFQPDRENALVSSVLFHPGRKEMRGFVAMKRNPAGQMTELIRADRASWDEERGLWHLSNGHSMKLGGDAELMAQDELGRNLVDEYVSDLTPKELSLQQATLWTSLVSMPELDRMQERFGEAGAGEFIKIKHKRLTTILVNMIFLCLGIPFFLNRERPSILIAGGKCLLVCGVCYVFTFVAQGVDLSILGVQPALPIWLPVLIFGPLAVLSMDGIKT